MKTKRFTSLSRRAVVATAISAASLASSMAMPAGAATAPTNTLKAGQSIACGKSLVSTNGYFRFAVQCDGNLVVLDKANQVRWASGTNGKGGTRLVQQTDGNLVMLTAANKPVWNSGQYGNPGTVFKMQDDGNAVQMRGSTPLWHTKSSANCDAGKVCLYDGAAVSGYVNFDTKTTTIANYTSPKRSFHNGTALNDKASAIYNNTNDPICFFDGANYTGASVCLQPHTKNTALGALDNKISSHRASTVQDKVMTWATKAVWGNAISGPGTISWPGGAIPYKYGAGWGATPGPQGGIDCGGFTRWMYALATGQDVLGSPPGGQQENATRFVRTSNPVPGDLVFFQKPGASVTHHVGIYAGNGQMINALKTGTNVRVDPIGHAGETIFYMHFTG
jgi:cell wall-associated NlpC family hydrolase